jgi:hypothetical protein
MNPMRGVRRLHIVFGQWAARRPREPEGVFLEEAVRISVPKQSAKGDAVKPNSCISLPRWERRAQVSAWAVKFPPSSVS